MRDETLRRNIARSLFAILLVVMVLDVFPWGTLPSDRPKELLAEITDRSGLWQSQWTMFSPRPSVNHYWFTATAYDREGNRVQQWSSPYWQNESTLKKFFNFRFMNYYNRLALPKNRIATRDFADYLARAWGQSTGSLGRSQDGRSGELLRVELFMNNVEMVPPEAGSLPLPEDVGWLVQSTQLETVDPFSDASTAEEEVSVNMWNIP